MTTSSDAVPGHVVAPSGDGAELLDGPAAFYLTYQERIDGWAKLRDTTRAALREWYRAAIAPAIDIPGWEPGHDDKAALLGPIGRTHLAGAGLSWDSGELSPYVCVWAADATIAARITQAAGSLCTTDGYDPWGTTMPAWRTIRLQPQWWADLDAHRTTLVDEATCVIGRFRAAVEAAST